MPSLLQKNNQGAFTLIELLTSMVVLSLLLVMVTQMMNSAMAVSSNSTKRMSADAQARFVFDRMAIDFAKITKRLDVDYYFAKSGVDTNAADDQMAFYSESTGYFPSNDSSLTSTTSDPKSNASLVGYCIRTNSKTNRLSLARMSKALYWNGVGGATGPRTMKYLPQTLSSAWNTVFFANASSNSKPDMSLGTDADFQTVGDQVFRMEISYLLRNSATTAQYSGLPYVTTTTTAGTADPKYNSLHDVLAFIVSLAVLDNQSGALVRDGDLEAASTKLQHVGGPILTDLPAKLWQKVIDSNSLVTSNGSPGLLRPAASQVRIYQRFFYINNAQ